MCRWFKAGKVCAAIVFQPGLEDLQPLFLAGRPPSPLVLRAICSIQGPFGCAWTPRISRKPQMPFRSLEKLMNRRAVGKSFRQVTAQVKETKILTLG